MSRILQLTRRLDAEPTGLDLPGVGLRTYTDGDAPTWLTLREQAFAAERPRPGIWSQADFHREFTGKDWWRPERMWLAFAGSEPSRVVGAVTLGLRGAGADPLPVVHWLMVVPPWRGRGVGALLLSALEREAWHSGVREIRVETHAGWQAAARFYQAHGYREINEGRR